MTQRKTAGKAKGKTATQAKATTQASARAKALPDKLGRNPFARTASAKPTRASSCHPFPTGASARPKIPAAASERPKPAAQPGVLAALEGWEWPTTIDSALSRALNLGLGLRKLLSRDK